MTEYVVGYLKALKDPESMAAYRAQAKEALAQHGGEILLPPTAPERLEGGADTPKAFVLLRFPDGDAAKAWLADPALKEVHALRHAGADLTFFLLQRAA